MRKSQIAPNAVHALTMPQCSACPDPVACARLLEEKWKQAYQAVFRFGACPGVPRHASLTSRRSQGPANRQWCSATCARSRASAPRCRSRISVARRPRSRSSRAVSEPSHTSRRVFAHPHILRPLSPRAQCSTACSPSGCAAAGRTRPRSGRVSPRSLGVRPPGLVATFSTARCTPRPHAASGLASSRRSALRRHTFVHRHSWICACAASSRYICPFDIFFLFLACL